MANMATTGSRVAAKLPADAGLAEVIEVVNELTGVISARQELSPSRPLDAPHPSATLVYTDEEYDAFVERLEAPPAPSDELRRTMAGAKKLR